MRNNALSLAGVAALSVSAPAMADPVRDKSFSVDVAHGDLDRATRDGVARLDERLRTHIRRMCANGGRDQASIQLERACRTSAIASAKPALRLAVAQARANAVHFAEAGKATSAANNKEG